MLSVPETKLQAIKTQLSTEKKSISMGCYWVNNDPHASWEKLCSKLYMMKEERAVAKAIQYLPKGNITLFILFYSVCILIKNGCTSLHIQPRSQALVYGQRKNSMAHTVCTCSYSPEIISWNFGNLCKIHSIVACERLTTLCKDDD